MSTATILKSCIPEHWRQYVRERQVSRAFFHVRGPETIEAVANEAVVTCLVKNGQFYLDQFVEHYFGLGFKHIVFLDNGSTDNTIEHALKHRNVTVYRCVVPVGAHQRLLKKQLAQRAVPAGWCLDVDIDEFFDYPCSDVLPLSRFLDYLNGKGYGAVLTQMLDMFPDRPMSSLAHKRRESLKQDHCYYDLSEVTRIGYLEEPLTAAYGGKNTIAMADTAVYWGGIRKTILGIHCFLTKHSLFRTGDGLQLFPHVHYVNGARLADVSGVLLHYKFASNAADEAAQNQSAFAATRHNYNKVIGVITAQPDLRIRRETARTFRRAGDLIEHGFLFGSQEFRTYANQFVADAPQPSGEWSTATPVLREADLMMTGAPAAAQSLSSTWEKDGRDEG